LKVPTVDSGTLSGEFTLKDKKALLMQEEDNQSEYWDRVAWEKTCTLPLDFNLLQSHVQPDQTVLEYGCGYGRICQELVQHGYTNVTGIDSSREMIARGKKEFPELNLTLFDGKHLPFEKHSFHAVLLVGVLTSIPDDDAQRHVLQNIDHVLRPGGLLCICDFPLQTDKRNFDRYQKYKEKFGTYGIFELEEGVVLRHHDMNWIESLTVSYEEIHLSRHQVTTMNGHQAMAFQYFGRKS